MASMSQEISNLTKSFTENLSTSQRTPQKLQAIEEMARQFVGQSKGKTKNVEVNEQQMEIINKKVEEERDRLIKEERKENGEVKRKLFTTFQNLQLVVEKFGLHIETPEFVVVGMQSDGKSSFIEALLGFQFNIIDSSIGTRRPLIIQMKNRPTAEEPLCRFKREDSMEFESPISVGLLNQEIVRRTDEVCGRGENVSKKPITLRVDYKYSSNLTIIDTPGFRIGGDQHIKYEIEEMVKELIQVKGRMVICLEQSTVEWANTVSRPFVLTLDPKLERTVLIQTKFDNRVKEFTKGEMANKYLIGEDITKRKKPYFISLPIRRGLSKEKYLVEIRERYLEDYKKLLMVDFDEKTFLQNIGMVRVKDVLEKELLKRYSSQLKPTMDYLRNEIIKTDKSVNAYELELSRTSDLGDIKSRVLRYVSTFNTSVEKLITGECGVEPDQFGQTIRDEIEGSGVGNWPNFDFDFNIENNGLKLYGGAQYERLMKEIEYVMYSREIPLPTVDEVCVTLGMKQIGSSFGGIDRAASGIIKSKANGVVIPVVGMALRRIEYVFDRLYEIAIAYVSQTSNDKYGGDQFTIFSGFKTFQHKLKEVFYKYVEERRNECYKQLTQDFGSFTATVDWQILTTGSMHQDFSLSRTNSFNSTMDAPKTNEKSNSTETTRERVEKMMKERMENSENLLKEMRNVKMWDVKGETYQKLCEISERLFAVIRDTFSGIMRNKINSYFLQPMLSDMKNSLSDTFRLLSDDDLKDIFQKGNDEIKHKLSQMKDKLKNLNSSYDEFVELNNMISQVGGLKTTSKKIPSLKRTSNPLESDLTFI